MCATLLCHPHALMLGEGQETSSRPSTPMPALCVDPWASSHPQALCRRPRGTVCKHLSKGVWIGAAGLEGGLSEGSLSTATRCQGQLWLLREELWHLGAQMSGWLGAASLLHESRK